MKRTFKSKDNLGRLDETDLRTSQKISKDSFKICPRNFIDETGPRFSKLVYMRMEIY